MRRHRPLPGASIARSHSTTPAGCGAVAFWPNSDNGSMETQARRDGSEARDFALLQSQDDHLWALNYGPFRAAKSRSPLWVSGSQARCRSGERISTTWSALSRILCNFGPPDRPRAVRRFGEERTGENAQCAFRKRRGPKPVSVTPPDRYALEPRRATRERVGSLHLRGTFFCYWRISEVGFRATDVCLRGQSGHSDCAGRGPSSDPKRTSPFRVSPLSTCIPPNGG